MNHKDLIWFFKFKVRNILALVSAMLGIYAASCCGIAVTEIIIRDWTEDLWRLVGGECVLAATFGVFSYGVWQATKQVQWLWFRTEKNDKHWIRHALIGTFWDR